MVSNAEKDAWDLRKRGLKLNVMISEGSCLLMSQLNSWYISLLNSIVARHNFNVEEYVDRQEFERRYPEEVDFLVRAREIYSDAIDGIVKLELPMIRDCIASIDFNTGEVWVIPVRAPSTTPLMKRRIRTSQTIH